MTLNICRECGVRVGAQDHVCPNCGVHYPTASNPIAASRIDGRVGHFMRRGTTVVIVLVLIGIMLIG